MTTIAYLRVSKSDQDADNQKLAILEYARNAGIHIDKFVAVQVSSRKSTADRGVDDLVAELSPGDTVLVSEISRLGRSLPQIVGIVNAMTEKGVRLICLKEGMDLNGKKDLNGKVTLYLFGILAEVERDLISQRTKEALLAARAKGKRLGRPPGPGKSKLDDRRQEIEELLGLGVSRASIAKIMRVSRGCLYDYVKKRNLA